MGHREIIFFTLMVSVILPTNSLSSITTVSEDTPFSATNDVNSKMQSTPKIDQNATFQTVTNKTISVISTFETETVSQPNTITKITSTEAIDAPESLTSTNKEVTNNIEQTSMIEEKTILNITSPASSTGKTLQLYPTTAITISKPPTSTWLPPSFSAPEISSVVKETATAKALATVNPRQLLLTISDTQQMNVNEENNSSTIKISPMLITVNQVQPYLTSSSSSSSSSSSVSKLTPFLTTNDVDLKMQATPEINPNVISQSDTNRTMSVVSTFVTKIVAQPKTKIASTETTEAQESVTSTAEEVTNNIEQTNANLNIVTSALSTVPTPYLYPTTSMTSSDPLTPTSSFSSFSSPDTKPLVKETSTALASASLSTSSPSITTKLNTETATMNTSTTFKSSTPHPTTTNNTPNPSSSSSSTSSSKSSKTTTVREKTTIGNSSTTVKPSRPHSTKTEKTSSQSSSSLSSSSPLPSLSSESSSARWTSKILLTTLTTNQRGNELNYLNSKISDLNGDISSLQVAVAMLSILLVLILVLCLIYFIRRRKRPAKSPFAEMAADKIELKLRKNEGARPYFDITHNQFRQSTASLGENTGEAMSAETFKPPIISVHSELNGADESCDTNMENV